MPFGLQSLIKNNPYANLQRLSGQGRLLSDRGGQDLQGQQNLGAQNLVLRSDPAHFGHGNATPPGADTVEISPATQRLLAGGTATSATAAPAPTAAAAAPPPDMQQMAAMAGQAIALQVMLAHLGVGTGGSANTPASGGGATVTADQPPATEAADTTPAPPPVVQEDLANTVQLGDVNITNVTETAFDESTGQVAAATGELDLSAFGLGTVQVDLQMADGEVVGATSRDDTIRFGTGDLSLTVGNPQGDLLSVDANGAVAIQGGISLALGNASPIDLGQADVLLQDGGFSLTAGAADGAAGLSLAVSGNEISINASKDFVGTLIGGLAGATMGNAFTTLTNFMDAVGASGDTGGSEFSLTVAPDAFAFNAFGLSGSFGTNAEGDKEISVGGFSLGAGINVSVENVTVDESGDLSASVAAGVGASIGSVGIGFDLAGFELGYDSDSGDISFSGQLGTDFMNIQASVSLTRGANGYTLGGVDFSANVNTAAAREVAAGLQSAYNQGTVLGAQAYNQVRGLGREAAQKFAGELQNVGANMQGFLNDTASVLAQHGEAELNRALDYGAQGVTAVARHGLQVFNAAAELGSNAAGAMNTLATTSAGAGQQALEGFINSNVASKAGKLVSQGGKFVWEETRSVSHYLNFWNVITELVKSTKSLSDL